MPRTPEPSHFRDEPGRAQQDEFDDDAALRWDDIDDPSYAHTGSPSVGAGERDGTGDPTSGDVREGDARVGDAAASGEHPRGAVVASRVVTVMGAVVFAAYTLAWVVGVGTLPLSGPTLLLEVLYQFGEFLAIIASGLWFGATLVLTRGRPGLRAGWFALGALVLAPWPFVFGVIG